MQDAGRKIKVLFLCTGNSCRSQMAEGWARYFHGRIIEAYSAGMEAHGLDLNAVAVMKEAGADISKQRSKTVNELEDMNFDFVVTVCGHANERCPVFPGKVKIIHVGFDDPPKPAATERDKDAALAHYRRVRDEIRDFVQTLPDVLAGF